MIIIENIKSVRGNISLPGDKSIAHRAIIHAAVSMSDCSLSNVPESEDILSTINALRQMGVSIKSNGYGDYLIKGTAGELAPADSPINCGNSATTIRLLLGVLASNPFSVEFTGDKSLMKRPMERLAEPLRQMGVEIITTNGHGPIKMTGKKSLKPLHYDLSVPSAQVKSALIYAALQAYGESIIREFSLSRDHTEIALENMINSNYFREPDGDIQKHIINGPCIIPGISINIPGDTSSAAYLIALALCLPDSEITIHGMLLNQRRIQYLMILRNMGADITIMPSSDEAGEIVGDVTARSSCLKNVEISNETIPLIIDEIPLLIAVALRSEGDFTIRNATELRHKESDRLKAMIINLRSLGVKIDEYPDGLSFNGDAPLQKASVEHFNDHRILMSLIVLSIISGLEFEFDNLKPLNVSFPEFLDYLSLL